MKLMFPDEDLRVQFIELMIRIIAKIVSQTEEDSPAKYGVDFENDVFSIHRYCWCEREECPYCSEENKPNFHHKASGLAVHWYKYIGRGMEVSCSTNSIEKVFEILGECLDSLKLQT